LLWVCMQVRCPEGEIQKSANVRGHSPGKMACPNVGLFIDSHAQQGILHANGRGGWSTIVKGEEVD
jgi:hypothetical protein